MIVAFRAYAYGMTSLYTTFFQRGRLKPQPATEPLPQALPLDIALQLHLHTRTAGSWQLVLIELQRPLFCLSKQQLSLPNLPRLLVQCYGS